MAGRKSFSSRITDATPSSNKQKPTQSGTVSRQSTRTKNVHPLAYNERYHPSDDVLRPNAARKRRHAVGEYSQDKDETNDGREEDVELASRSPTGPKKRMQSIMIHSDSEDEVVEAPTKPPNKRVKLDSSSDARDIAAGCDHLKQAMMLLGPHLDKLTAVADAMNTMDVSKLESLLGKTQHADLRAIARPAQALPQDEAIPLRHEPANDPAAFTRHNPSRPEENNLQTLLTFQDSMDALPRFSGVGEIQESIGYDGAPDPAYTLVSDDEDGEQDQTASTIDKRPTSISPSLLRNPESRNPLAERSPSGQNMRSSSGWASINGHERSRVDRMGRAEEGRQGYLPWNGRPPSRDSVEL